MLLTLKIVTSPPITGLLLQPKIFDGCPFAFVSSMSKGSFTKGYGRLPPYAMAEFHGVKPKRFAPDPLRQTSETRYWKSFKNPILSKQVGAVTGICFSPVAPHQWAISSATRVIIYSPRTHEPKRTISRFMDIAYSPHFRHDGKLIVAGGEEPAIRIFDANSRAILRTLNGHSAAVHLARFSPDGNQLVTGGDDKTVRLWDITSEKELNLLSGHKDYVRCGTATSQNGAVWATGSYDTTVKVWDTRANKNIMEMDHGFPVEAVVSFPDGGTVVTAGRNVVKFWDLLGGGRLIHEASNHQKTVTCLGFDSSYSRLLTGSLDHQVKVIDVRNYNVLASLKYPAPILSMGLSPDSSHLVVGMADGMLSMRQRVVKMEDLAVEKSKANSVRAGSYRYFLRGQGEIAAEDDYVVDHVKKTKLKAYDNLLRKFQYKKALDAALDSKQPLVVLSLLEELSQRDGMIIALSGRDEVTLEPLLHFLVKHINNPKYSTTLIDVSNELLNLYSSVVGQSMTIDELLVKLQRRIEGEVQFQKNMYSMLGMLDTLMASSSNAVATPTL